MTQSLPIAHPIEPRAGGTVLLLTLMMFLVPALGASSLELLQDTLKSMLVSFFVLGSAFVYFWHQRKASVPMHLHALLCLPLGLMLYALASMVWSHTYLGGAEAIRWFLFSLILLLGMNTLTLARVTHLAWGIHLGAVLASLWGALQFWFGFDYFTQGPNPASTFVNRNFFAEYLVCTLPFSALLLNRVQNKSLIFLVTATLGLNIVALMMTGTRSALAGLLVLLVLLPAILWLYRAQAASFGWRSVQRVLLLALFIGTVGGLGAINTGNPKLIAEFGRSDAMDRSFVRAQSVMKADEYTDGTFSVRMLLWKSTGRMVLAKPLLGVGAGAWLIHVPLYQEPGSQMELEFYAHNEALQLLAEYGLVGWLFLLVLLTYLSWAAFRTWSEPSIATGPEAPVRALALSSLLVLLIVSNAGFPWRLATTGALFALSLAILVASDLRLGCALPRGSRTVNWTAAHSIGAVSVLLFCMALAAYISWLAVQSESRFARAKSTALMISQSGAPDHPRWEQQKADILQWIKEGIAINPHDRKFIPHVAEELSTWGDWKNAIWINEIILATHPYVVGIITNTARGYLMTGDEAKALQLYDRAAQLQPSAPAVRALQTDLLILQGHYPQAEQIIRDRLDADTADNDLINSAFVIGIRTNHWDLVIRALELRVKKLPKEAPMALMHLGDIYSRPEVGNEAKALESYRAALAMTPAYLRDSLWRRIPPALQARLSSQ